MSLIHYLAGSVTTLLAALSLLYWKALPHHAPRPVTSGVPQGSILEHLLFILTFDGTFRPPLSSGSNLTSLQMMEPTHDGSLAQ